MYLRLTPNLLHFLSDLDALYALRCTPNFYEIHPLSTLVHNLVRQQMRCHFPENEAKFRIGPTGLQRR
jgi:hypothetical protein